MTKGKLEIKVCGVEFLIPNYRLVLRYGVRAWREPVYNTQFGSRLQQIRCKLWLEWVGTRCRVILFTFDWWYSWHITINTIDRRTWTNCIASKHSEYPSWCSVHALHRIVSHVTIWISTGIEKLWNEWKHLTYRIFIRMIMARIGTAKEPAYFKDCSKEFKTIVVAYPDLLMTSKIIFR